MNRSRLPTIVLILCCYAGGEQAPAQSKAKAGTKSKPAAAKPPAPPQPPARKLEIFVMLPEPKAMRTDRSRFLPDAKKSIISPAHETADASGVRAYTAEEFARLGISVDTFMDRARSAADRRLAEQKPDFIKDAEGRLRYAVYRSDSPLTASLLMAPSLGAVFREALGGDVWAVAPDRNSLFIFPAKPEALEEFAPDLRDRYDSNPFAASPEVFLMSATGGLPRVVGAFGG
ncbi:MAG: hypothetical protein K1X78_08035 [Verrucomicrobiaceae bacterium]|nr:hypothetical protein [Verrucomicrobiaceae bacterium]